MQMNKMKNHFKIYEFLIRNLRIKNNLQEVWEKLMQQWKNFLKWYFMSHIANLVRIIYLPTNSITNGIGYMLLFTDIIRFNQ